MVCNNCGKEATEGATFCEGCGAPLEEPVIIKMSKDDIKKANKKYNASTPTVDAWVGPAFNFSRYVSDLKNDTTALFALVGALLMYLSPFFSWLWRKNGDVKCAANLFDLSRKNGDLALNSFVIFLLAVLVILTGISMMIMSASSNLKFMQPYLENKMIYMIPLFVAVIVYVLITANSKYDQAYDIIMTQLAKAEASASGTIRFSGGRGFGPILYGAGLVSYLLSALSGMAKQK